MSDLISRKAILKHIEKIRQGVQMMDDTRRASIIMNGMYLCEKAVMNQPSEQPEIIRCRDCKHFELNHWENVNGTPLIVAHEICMRWGEGCKTFEDGWCFMAERRDNGNTE